VSVDDRFVRSEALLGAEAMKRLAAAHVLVVGVGGVGSWCAEALVRTGLGHVTLVDDDTVVTSNLNRQCPATIATLGRPKVEAMKERLNAINPQAEVIARFEKFDGFGRNAADLSQHKLVSGASLAPRATKTGGLSHHLPVAERQVPLRLSAFGFERLDLVVDAIDSVDCKAELILGATEAGVPIVSSMGAALRTDPTKVRVTRFEKVEGDGLAKALRQRFKKLQRFPAAKFTCVWSAEPPLQLKQSNNSNDQTRPKGSLMPVTATFGMCLASEAIRILAKGEKER